MDRMIEEPSAKSAGEMLPAPAGIVPDMDQTALLLDIDGTLLELAPTPRDVVVPPKLGVILQMLHDRLDGALALVSGRSLTDIDVIFAPLQFPAVGGHGAEMRLSVESEAVASCAPPMDNDLKRRFIAISQLAPAFSMKTRAIRSHCITGSRRSSRKPSTKPCRRFALTCRRRPSRFFLENSFARSSPLDSPKRRAFAN